jgi:ankyrin repeat protein
MDLRAPRWIRRTVAHSTRSGAAMTRSRAEDPLLARLIRAILAGNSSQVAELLAQSPGLARQSLKDGATRQNAKDHFFGEIGHYLYAGDTPLHAAAAGHRKAIAELLIKAGADVAAKNRRGATPLHYAADGNPNASTWNQAAQVETIACLLDAGADANAFDKSGVTPLHRAVRQRCAGAVDVLLRKGANVRMKNKSGSTPLHLAVRNTGRGGSGSPEAKELQKQIIELLLKHGASLKDKDASGKTAHDAAISDWIRELL